MKRLLSIFLAAIIAIISPMSASASSYILDDSTMSRFSKNGIYYYNPKGVRTCTSFSGNITVYGSTAAEKIWTGLTSFMSEEQAAGIMGNMQHESNYFNPVQHEISKKNEYQPGFNLLGNPNISYGVGLIQWSFSRRINLLNYIKSQNAELLSYFENYEKYSPDYTITGDKFIELTDDQTADTLIAIELQFLKDELENSWPEFFNTSSTYDAAKYFLEKVEIPQNPYISSHPERVTDAEKYYSEFSGKTISASNFSNSVITDGSTLNIIGDSITEGSKSDILSLMDKTSIDSEVGRSFESGIEILKNTELKDSLVFALGTNSVNVSESQINEVIRLTGNHNLYFITNYTTSNDYANNNSLFKSAADNNSNVYLIDWAKSVSDNPSKYLGSDGIHPTEDGRKLFAELIYNAITSHTNLSDGCVTASGNYGTLQEYVLKYAWPDYHRAPYTELMPDYNSAVSSRLASGAYVGGIRYRGVDCGGFVTTLMQESGFEPDYNTGDHAGATDEQEAWVKSHGWTLLNSSESTEIDTSVLQPGDVAFSTGHTFVYVGDIPGFNSKIASASLDERAPMAGHESLIFGNGTIVRWYRKG